VIFGIVSPEVIPLCIDVAGVSECDVKDLLHKDAVFEGHGAQLSPSSRLPRSITSSRAASVYC